MAAIAIPIIIHLFNFRRYRKVYFTNVRFIDQVRKKTRRKSQLKHLIVLMLRILAIASMVMAFAQPYIPLQEETRSRESERLVSIYIDNSFSMQALTGSGSALDMARRIAEEIAEAYSPSDVFHIITNDFDRKHQRILNRDDFIQALSGVNFSPAVRKTGEIFARQKDFLFESGYTDRQSFIISDFQKSIAAFSAGQIDTSAKIYLVPVMATQSENIYIDSCWFENPVHQIHQQSRLLVRLKNASGIDYEKIPLKLIVNGVQKALASFNIASGEHMDVSIPFTHHEAGIKKARLEIDDYPVIYDDAFYFSYYVQDLFPVLSIYDELENPYLSSFYGSDSLFSYSSQPETNLNYSAFQLNNLIVLDQLKKISSGLVQELLKFVQSGGSLLIIPSTEMDQVSYRLISDSFGACSYGPLDTVRSKVTSLNLQHPLFFDVFEKWPDDPLNQFRNIDLPIVFQHFPLRCPALSLTETLITLGNGRDFLNVLPVEKGKLYLLASPLDPDFTNLPRHAIFVPVLYKIALNSQPLLPMFHTIGRSDKIKLPWLDVPGDQILKIREEENGKEFIPERRDGLQGTELILHQQVRDAGHYSIIGDEQSKHIFSFNFDRRESDLTLLGEEEIEGLISSSGAENLSIFSFAGKPVARSIQELNEGIKLWKLFIIFVLFFLAAETVLLRFWK